MQSVKYVLKASYSITRLCCNYWLVHLQAVMC